MLLRLRNAASQNDSPLRRTRAIPASLLLSLALLTGCATVVNPVTGEAERTVMDERAEVAQGLQGHQQVLKEYAVHPDAALQRYVDTLGQRLAAQSHRRELKWHFTVLDSPEVNAFALPGGYIYVTRGIMAYLNSEADLAGVIGHEIGHVTARHGAQRATRQQTAGLGVIAATILGSVLESQGIPGAGDLAGRVSQGVAAGHLASYSRDQELQADELGAEYLARNGYDPKNMIDVIGVLKNQERFAEDQARAAGRTPTQRNTWLSSHPSNDQRLHDITRHAAQYGGTYQDDGTARYLAAIDGLTYGDSAEQGVVRGRHFYHEPLGIALTAPAGWKIRNSPEAIVIVNEAEDAGLITTLVPPQAGRTHDDVIRNVIKPLGGQVSRRTINGFAATHATGTRRNAQGRTEAFEATVVTGPEGRNYLLARAGRDTAALQRARNGFADATDSFRPLSATDRAAARPWRIRIVTYPRGGFAELARRSPLGDDAERQLRLINGWYGGGEPTIGQRVKIVE